MALNKLQLTLSTAALALMAGPALAVDYVQCNAMKVAYDSEMAALSDEDKVGLPTPTWRS